jgi:hypothetical protein
MTQYYRTDFTRLSWLELWCYTPTVRHFLLAAILRLSGTHTAPRCGFARDGLRFIEPCAIPDDAAIRLKSVTDACAPLGFRPCLWSTVDAIGPAESYGVTMRDSSGTVYTAAAWVRLAISASPREELVFTAVSRLIENRLVITTNGKKRLNPPKGFQVLHLPGRDVRSVLNTHHERLSEVRGENIVRLDEDSLRETVLEASKRSQDYQIERGILSPLSADQVAAIINQPGSKGTHGTSELTDKCGRSG